MAFEGLRCINPWISCTFHYLLITIIVPDYSFQKLRIRQGLSVIPSASTVTITHDLLMNLNKFSDGPIIQVAIHFKNIGKTVAEQIDEFIIAMGQGSGR